jgi:hypothetical protein
MQMAQLFTLKAFTVVYQEQMQMMTGQMNKNPAT